MIWRLQLLLTVLLILTASSFCKTIHTNNSTTPLVNNNCCIDTFKLKYQISLGGGKIRKVDENIYVGVLTDAYAIGNKAYRKMVFGDSLNSVIGFVRQDEGGLYYVDTSYKNIQEEKALLYFTKKVNDKWMIHIDNSYFYRKEIEFMGIDHDPQGDVYVYNVKTDKDYTSLGNNIAKIFYSKEKGFLKFVIKTHWANIEVGKSK